MLLLTILDILLIVVGGVGMGYQALCILISLFAKPVVFPAVPMDKRYAVLISARNEEAVIGNLIRDIQLQSYPSHLIDVWVVADNCTDSTAQVVRDLGGNVVERFDTTQIGKGYALTYLLNTMIESRAADAYDAFFVFDADNRLDEHYFEEMNKGFQAGFRILTSYRNSVNLSENWVAYDAFFVFDADNRLDEHYFEEMNKGFQAGFRILTSYRNSVNLSENWVSSGSALWFIRESRFLSASRMWLGNSCHVGGTGFMFSQSVMRRNKGWKFHLLTEDLEFESRFLSASRMWLGNSCHVGGTGFMFSQSVMRRNKGWKFHLLTEDLEFTMDSLLHGDRIGYVGTAILYDEQPVTFAQSWRQRLRWSKGFLQVFRYYGPALVRRAIKERDFAAIDFTLLLCPFTVLTMIRIALGIIYAAFGFVTWQSQLGSLFNWVNGIVYSIIFMMALAALTIVVERKQIGATNKELFAYVLSFPIYMLSYVPISFQAVFAKAEWKPIEHKGGSTTA